MTYELKDTLELMASENYKERFVAEYLQAKIRYEKLKTINARIEAARLCDDVSEPKYDCPKVLLLNQKTCMEEYLKILEVRAVIEKIDLSFDAVFETMHNKASLKEMCELK